MKDLVKVLFFVALVLAVAWLASTYFSNSQYNPLSHVGKVLGR